MIKEYEGIPVIHKKQWKTPEVNASYNRFSQVITIYDIFYTRSKVIQKSILEHEYSHHIYWMMPLVYRKLWEYISKWKLTKLLRIMWITTHTKNAYVTEYAATKVTEDWAECIEYNYLFKTKYKGKRLWTFADVKIKIAYAMYTYFSNK